MFRAMRTQTRTRALLVVAVATIAGLVAGTQAFGLTGGRRFASSPSQAVFGHVPNTLNNVSRSNCPAGGQSVAVHLMQGTTTLGSASVISDAKGKWAVAMSIPTNLTPGSYVVTASCSNGSGTTLSYNPQPFTVKKPFCPTGSTTSTTQQCRVRPTTTTTVH
jgi:hypothetical protein